ncbi:glycoside hydrolase family 15 protein [Neomoorella carbonis]|uniref:glycoside hydrolase family 15 protein n=1 Tax=Neomoorella carbonis TaxID=3062783 RepID=UPI0032500CBD
MKTIQLCNRSIDVLKAYQAPTGAFPAAPDYPPYNYVWLRDGTFIARALDLVGEREGAAAFYRFASRTIVAHGFKVERALAAAACGRPIDDGSCLHTRYTLSGEEGREPWGNFQLDGYGTFLWGLAAHLQAGGPWEDIYRRAVDLVVRYLTGLWQHPCLDCWEEYGDYRHPSTLAAIYGGLKAILPWLEDESRKTGFHDAGGEPEGEQNPGRMVLKVDDVLERLPELARSEFIRDGNWVKFAGQDAVDANLLWLGVPFGLCSLDDPVFTATVARIATELCSGGVKRYAADTYYGGGQWLLLTAWLAWYYRLRGEEAPARELLAWVEDRADNNGFLPEQVPENLTSEAHYHYWLERWGPIANPLLWSHAMYIISVRGMEV